MEFPHTRSPGYFQQGVTDHDALVVAPVLGWGEHGGVVESGRDPDKAYGHFIPCYTRRRELWTPVEVVPSPLLPPNTDCPFAPVTEVDLVYKKRKVLRHTKQEEAGVTLGFSRQISRFCWDHNRIAFQCMSRLLEPHCYVGDTLITGKVRDHVLRMTPLMQTLQTTPYQNCPFAHRSYLVRSLSYITRGWLQDLPPELLAHLVNEGMAEDWRDLQFQASLTGGALSWTSYPGSSYGCLIYPRGAAMNILNFQQLRLDPSDGLRVKLQGDAAAYEVQGRILQVAAGKHEQTVLGVRSSYHLASWRFSVQDPPEPLCVLRTRKRSTCISASPHIAAEFCVCTESGTLYLWEVESGLQRVRQDPDTFFFRDDPSWRWSDFTSHPRVLTYADRTGVQLADVRVPNSQGPGLFRIGQESSCQSGERVILPRCLRETNPAHYLVTTQFSLYIMDERFPLVPLVKWDHMLGGPPTYASVIPGGATDKILLGTQHSQETLMVQYSGGGSGSCHLHLPAAYLPQISASLDHLPPLLPHHRDTVLPRLQSPLAGLVAASPPGTEDRLLVFQLTAAGDVFIQRLTQEAAEAPAETCGVASPVCDSAPEEPDDDHQSVCTDETDSRCSGPRQQGAQSRSTRTFCRWLHEVYRACPWRGTVLRPRCHVHKLLPSEEMSDRSEEVAGLRERLRESMKGGELVPYMTESPSHRLEAVHSESWKDPLSQRLTASWEGRLGFWWEDHLGTNKESKIQALREKRRRQKLLRSRSPSQLSGSFTSSIASDPYETETGSQVSCVSATETAPYCPSVPSTSQDCAKDVFQVPGTSSAILSSQHLQAKGIPRERRQMLREFLSTLDDGSSTGAGPEPSISGSFSQRSQPPSKRSRMGF